jgi:hypothetical protein
MLYYSKKEKEKHAIKTQIVLNQSTKQIVCMNFSEGKEHNLRLFKESKIP